MKIEELKKIIGIIDVAIVKEKAYISNRFYNALIVYNIQDDTIERVERFVHMEASAFAYHGGCVEHNGVVYFYPDSGYGVHAYNPDSGCQKYYDLGFGKVGYSHIYDEKLVLVPWYAEQGLITIDLKNETSIARSEWWDASRILDDAKTNSLFTGAYDDQRVWSHCTKTNYLIITDYQKHLIEKHMIDVDEKALLGSAYDGKDFWFTVVGKDILYQWNIEHGLQNRFMLGLTAWEKTNDTSPYRKIVCAQGYIFLIPCDENALFLFHKETGKMEMLSRFPKETVYPKAKYWGIKEKIDRKMLYLFCDVTNLIIQVDLDSLNVRYIDTRPISDKIFDEYVKQMWNSILLEIDDEGFIGENGYDWKTCPSNFIRLDQKMYTGNAEDVFKNNIGNKIYRKVVTE